VPTRPPQHRPPQLGGKTPRQAFDQQRGTSADRGYDHRWRRFRLSFLASSPLCSDCQALGRVTAATDVHHVRKLRDHPELRLDPTNVMALCGPCHAARTAAGE
jgi:5-methylcytosine-specific restriction enzyme A